MRVPAAASIISLLVFSLCLSRQASAQAGSAPIRESEHPDSYYPNFIHGTIVVVVSTKNGFVLAGDSRGTYSPCTPARGEFEKVFPVGKQSGIVVAGLIVSPDATNELTEAVATQLHFFDNVSTAANQRPQATTAIREFFQAVEAEAEMFDTRIQPMGSEASAVSIDDKGVAEWITIKLSPIIRTYRGGKRSWGIRVEGFVDPPASKVLSLGAAEDIVSGLINRDSPDPNEPASQKEVMKRYYSLRRENRLSGLSLADGEALAQLLVDHAISFANAHPYPSYPCRGIGGSIEMLTITDKGAEWVHPPDKSKLAPMPPMYRAREIDSSMSGRLDGLEFLRGNIPADATLTFGGQGEVRIVQPHFSGPCTFVLESGAEEQMPGTAARLRTILGEWCDVYRQTQAGKVKLSTATIVYHPPAPSPANDYSSLCNRELKAKALELVTQLRNALKADSAADRQEGDEEWAAVERAPTREEGSIISLKYGFQRMDRMAQFDSEYDANFVPRADSLKHELLKRISSPVETGSDAGQKGWTPWEQYDVTNDLEKLANQIPQGDCVSTRAETTTK